MEDTKKEREISEFEPYIEEAGKGIREGKRGLI